MNLPNKILGNTNIQKFDVIVIGSGALSRNNSVEPLIELLFTNETGTKRESDNLYSGYP
jgi:hypothetical protein